MKVLRVSNTEFRIFDEELSVEDKLPTDTYRIVFNKMSGFSLKIRQDLEVTEKLYGPYPKKIDHIVYAFQHSSRSLGVIFSGPKGIGKSVISRSLCCKTERELNCPVIVVNEYIPGIIDFLDSIQQECVIFFDEFEKTFKSKDDGDINPQEDILNLFDGISSQKRMYIVTCNNVMEMNNYFLNRPGRFHYNIVLKYPTEKEVREYLSEHLKPEYQSKINQVIDFAHKVQLGYDHLRAIVFELNIGSSLKEIISDLNIKSFNIHYNICILCQNNTMMHGSAIFNMLSQRQVTVHVYDETNMYIGEVSFIPAQAEYDLKERKWQINKEKLYIDPANKKQIKPKLIFIETNEYAGMDFNKLII